MATNTTLTNAKTAKKDEFYTQLVDIEFELKHYKEYFRNKIVFCNCDDPFESNFFKYFAMNFNHLGLKKLICTCYDGSLVSYTQLSFFGVNENKEIYAEHRHAYKIEINEVADMNNDGAIDLGDIQSLLQNKKNALVHLKGNGDFRSSECVELLKTSDIVVTNPPYSLFKEYVPLLIQHNKKFIIMGPMNAITYKEIFPLIKDNKMWIGNGFNKTIKFQVPYYYKGYFENGVKYGKVSGICWYTNIDIQKRHEEQILYKKYDKNEYPKYETLDAIDVKKLSDIPCDYFGIMGVPKTFLDCYNPTQFEILGYEREDENIKVGIQTMPEEFLNNYRKQGGTGHYTKGMKMLCYYDEKNRAKIPFSRILIRRKQK